jgi:hypothetical protein
MLVQPPIGPDPSPPPACHEPPVAHWYHSPSLADCTQVPAGTARPKVADWQ